MDMEVLRIIFNGMTFGQRKAEKIAGGRGRLLDLVARGLIRREKRDNARNGKWSRDAYDRIKHARLNY